LGERFIKASGASRGENTFRRPGQAKREPGRRGWLRRKHRIRATGWLAMTLMERVFRPVVIARRRVRASGALAIAAFPIVPETLYGARRSHMA
jgi:hypothetical protein